MIEHCHVDSRLPCGHRTKALQIYLEHNARFATFTAAFDGDEHSLHVLTIEFNKSFQCGSYPASCLCTCQNVLEPFATLYHRGRKCGAKHHWYYGKSCGDVVHGYGE